ncbi:HAD-IA family hydrolase [Orrella sp. JC864]|uniref:HAD-IA family hydrolase n=1 Tax=Orrella sp. JC864 TaxID=3120298 RepID=UPI0012BD12FA
MKKENTLILFDFDGTLADTAPDLAAAANQQRLRRGLAPLPLAQLRPVASQGARGLLRVALDMQPDHPDYETTRQQFLYDYELAMTEHSRLFPGIAELLNQIEDHALEWGIVTNKISRLALPLIDHLGLTERSAATVCGDTTAHAKPHPEPLLHAARQAGYAPFQCIYVGDDLRDIQASHAAGMPAVAAAYGYCGDALAVSEWQAEAQAASPGELWPAIMRLIENRPQAS